MESKHYVLFAPVPCVFTAADIKPPRKAQTIPCRIAAAHDLHALSRLDRNVRLHLGTPEIALRVERIGKKPFKGNAMARNKCDGDTDKKIHTILHEAAIPEERTVSERIERSFVRTTGKRG